MKKEIIKNALLLLCGFSCYTCLESFGMEEKTPIVVDQSIDKYEKKFQALKEAEFSKEQHINNNLNVAHLLESQIPFLIAKLVGADDAGPYQDLISQWINGDNDLLAMPDFQNFQREYEDKADLLQLAFFIKSKANIQNSEFSDEIDAGYLLALARIALAVGRSINYVQSLDPSFTPSALGTCALRVYLANIKNILWVKPKDKFDQQAIIWNAGRIVFDFFGFTKSGFMSTLPDTDEVKTDRAKADTLRKIKDSEERMFFEKDTKYKEKTTGDPTIILLHHMIDNVHIWFRDEEWTKEDFKAYSSYKNDTKGKIANSAILIPPNMLPITNWFSETLNTLSSGSQNVRTYIRDHKEMVFSIPFRGWGIYTQIDWENAVNKPISYILFSINRDGVLRTMYPVRPKAVTDI